MAAPTPRRLVAYGAALAVLAAGVTFYVLTRPADEPAWAGPPLGTGRSQVTELVVDALAPADPAAPAGRALGAKTVTDSGQVQRGARVFRGGDDVEVHVRPDTPTVIFARRGAAPGEPPAEAKVKAAAEAVMRAYGMDPAQWTPTVRTRGGTRSVQFVVRADLPVFEAGGVPAPLASFTVDAKGVQAMTLTLVTFTPRPVEVMSQAEAFERVEHAARYERVRMVLVNAGKGAIQPYWEFAAADGKLRPVLAVLTP
ncbi:MAG TPA: hypothetical protein VNQ77_14525 [Frankiaceae bacterium]|nr:hypothetical protein [Frankiaceae bacterium]